VTLASDLTDTSALFTDFAVTAKLNGARDVRVIFDRDASLTLGVDIHTAAATVQTAHGIKTNDVLTIDSVFYRCVSRITGDDQVETWQLQGI
jgi:hypothetical protein